MAPIFALSTTSLSRSLPRAFPHATPVCSAGRIDALYSACFKQHYPSSLRCSSQPPSFTEAQQEQVPTQTFLSHATSENEATIIPRLLQHSQKLFTSSLGATLLLVALPANAEDALEDGDSLLIHVFVWLGVAILYLFVAPLSIYYYLYKRWFKRNMPEAIFQFWLVFMFFPGLLLWAPFINFRGAPKEGAKEPWDEIRP